MTKKQVTDALKAAGLKADRQTVRCIMGILTLERKHIADFVRKCKVTRLYLHDCKGNPVIFVEPATEQVADAILKRKDERRVKHALHSRREKQRRSH